MLIRWAKEAKNGPHTPASKPSLAPSCHFTMYLPGLLFTASSSWGRTDQEASRLNELGALSFSWFSHGIICAEITSLLRSRTSQALLLALIWLLPHRNSS